MTKVHDFALSATKKYLQSIVFVDDEIYFRVPAKDDQIDVVVPEISMKVFAKPVEPQPDLVKATGVVPAEGSSRKEDSSDGGGSYHPKYLVESFARERMVCALYEPPKGFSTDSNSEIFKLCERADVVILDWDFYQEPGTKVMELVGGLVSAAQTTVPHHVRLCAIYTSTQNLKSVALKLFNCLKELGLDVIADGEYNLNAGSSRIIVLGKPSTGRQQEQIEAAEVRENDLAQRIIKEFASMHEGILPSTALHGLASLRTNTKKILDKFQQTTDGAFLIHRGLIFPGDDAFEQIPELLAEEALAVIVDNWVTYQDAKDLSEQTIDDFQIKLALKDKKGNATSPGKHAIELLKEGAEKVRKIVELDPENLLLLHDELDTEKTSARERFAALYTSRTQYGPNRSLEFGTIVRYSHKNDKVDVEGNISYRYAICLMPLCDCVRLKKDADFRFPFWDLRVDNKKSPSKGVVVELPGEKGFIELFSMGKPRDQLWIGEFRVGEAGMVMAEKTADNFLFGEKDRNVEWIAQLKPSHAQRIAHDIGSLFSRVGVLEAEWLRRKADRQ